MVGHVARLRRGHIWRKFCLARPAQGKHGWFVAMRMSAHGPPDASKF